MIRAFLTAALLSSVAAGQIQVEDRPKVVDRTSGTKEDRAEALLRKAKALYAIALVRQRHERLIDALDALEEAAALDPESAEIRRSLVPLYATLGRDDDARKLCKDLLDADPHDFEIAFRYVRLLKAVGRDLDAVPVLKKAIASKQAAERPERLLLLLQDLHDLSAKIGDFREAAAAQEAIARTLVDHRESLLYGNGLTRESLDLDLAAAHEGLGKARVKLKEYDAAAKAFRIARDLLLKAEDPAARHEAVRLGWNLAEIAAARERWADAVDAVDDYLEHSPADLGPYEKKVEWLRKAGRDRDVAPALRRYAAKQPFHLGLQLLLAGELARDPRTRAESETMHLELLSKNPKPEVYRGLFRLHQMDRRMGEVLTMFDAAATKAHDETASATARESANDRGRAMLQVLREDPELVASLLPEALAELGRGKKRTIDTWQVLAALAARTRKLDQAEKFFRQCLTSLVPEQEFRVYAGLIEVLRLQRKHAETAELCRDAIAGKLPARNTNVVMFESHLAAALSEMGEYDTALNHAARAVQLSNDDGKVREWCHKAHILAEAGRHDDAIAECGDIIREFPQAHRVRSVRYTLSHAYGLKGDHAKAEEQLRLILETDPDAALANNNLGYQLAERNKDLPEAERRIRRAIEIDAATRREAGDDGSRAAYLDSLGWVLFRQQRFDEAREWLEKAAALFEGAEDPTVWEHLGDTYAKLDQPAKARDAWQTAMKLYAKSGKAKPDPRQNEVAKRLKSLQ